jgi:hypothetical protein
LKDFSGFKKDKLVKNIGEIPVISTAGGF